jgi:hypothetical protein
MLGTKVDVFRLSLNCDFFTIRMKSDMTEARTWDLEIGILLRECLCLIAIQKINYALFCVSATTGGAEDSGRGSNGGVWEWTTTVFAGHEGLVPTDHFTGYLLRYILLSPHLTVPSYSTDFFDGKHQVVVSPIHHISVLHVTESVTSWGPRTPPFPDLLAVEPSAISTSIIIRIHG